MENRTPSDKIFEDVWNVIVPYGATLDETLVEILGVPVEENQFGDFKRDLNEKVRVYLTIEKMCELYHDGFNITLVNPDSISTIYNIIEEHLNAFNKYKWKNVNYLDIPEDDLRKLDQFAEAIFNTNKKGIVMDNNNRIESPGLSTKSLNDLMLNSRKKSNEPTEEDLESIKRNSLVSTSEYTGGDKFNLQDILKDI